MNEGDDVMELFGHVRSGNVYKVALMLALTDTPFAFREVDLPGGAQRDADFLALNPQGKVPVLRHGETVIRQSNTALLHLAAHSRKFGSGPDASMRLRISEWMFFEQDLLFAGVGRRRFLIRTQPQQTQAIAFLGSLGEQALDAIDAAVRGRDWLAGEAASIADVCVYAYARLAEEAELDLGSRPALCRWRERLEGLPGWAPPEALLVA